VGGSESDSDNVSIGSSRGHGATAVRVSLIESQQDAKPTEEMWGAGGDASSSGGIMWGAEGFGSLTQDIGSSVWNSTATSAASAVWNNEQQDPAGTTNSLKPGGAESGPSDIWKGDSAAGVDSFPSVSSVSAGGMWNSRPFFNEPSLGAFQRLAADGWGTDFGIKPAESTTSWSTPIVTSGAASVVEKDIFGVGANGSGKVDATGVSGVAGEYPAIETASGTATGPTSGAGSIVGSQSVGGSSGNGSTNDAAEELIARMVNSNEGWGKRPVHQETPWEVEPQSPVVPVETQEQHAENNGSAAFPGPAKDQTGMYWDDGKQRTTSVNGVLDTEIGQWDGPPGSTPIQEAPSWGISAPKDAWSGAAGPSNPMFQHSGVAGASNLGGMIPQNSSWMANPPPDFSRNDQQWMGNSQGRVGPGPSDSLSWMNQPPPSGGLSQFGAGVRGFGSKGGMQYDQPPPSSGIPLKIDTWGDQPGGAPPNWRPVRSFFLLLVYLKTNKLRYILIFLLRL